MFCTMSIYVRVPPRIEIIICRFQRWSRAVTSTPMASGMPKGDAVMWTLRRQ